MLLTSTIKRVLRLHRWVLLCVSRWWWSLVLVVKRRLRRLGISLLSWAGGGVGRL